MRSQRWICAFAVGALALAATGCSVQRTATLPEESNPSKISFSEYSMMAPPAEAMKVSGAVVEGTVKSVGRPSWSTADRKKAKTEPGREEFPPIIYTPYRVKIDKRYKGEAGPYLDVKSFSGVIDGESTVFEESGFMPKEGDRVVVFVSYISSEKNGDRLAVPASVYTIEGADAVNGMGGDKPSIPVVELRRALDNK